MSTEYFIEKFHTAKNCLKSGGIDLMVSAWMEITFYGWGRASHPKPERLVQEFQALDAIFHAADSFGPAFGGEHVGVFKLSMQMLTGDELEQVRQRTLRFAEEAIRWGEDCRGWRKEEGS